MSSYQSLLTLTSVCRHWRSAALSYGPLWTNIRLPYTNLMWLSELVLRSKSYPLSVMFDPSESTFTRKRKQNFVFILSQVFRIHELAVTLNEDLSSIILPLMSKPIPLLHHLCLRSCDFLRSSIPPLFGNSTPNLNRLVLSHCVFNWRDFPVVDLSRLTVLIVEDSTAGGDMVEFLNVLGSMQSLQRLEMCHSLPFEGDTLPSTPVSFDTLVFLRLTDSVGLIGDFLSCIVLDFTAELDVSAEYNGSLEIGTMLSFCRRIGENTSGQQIGYIRDLCIDADITSGRLCFRGGMEAMLDNRYKLDKFKISLEWVEADSTSHETFHSLFCRFACSLDASSLRTLTLSLFEMPSSFWTQVLSKAGNLEEMNILLLYERDEFRIDPRGFLRALSVPLECSSTVSAILPNLKTLTFSQFLYLDSMMELFSFLYRRKCAGYSLGALAFHKGANQDFPTVGNWFCEFYARLIGLEYKQRIQHTKPPYHVYNSEDSVMDTLSPYFIRPS
ncbi:hypothetical protein AX16_008362 [Volvariella volvacea WC 439]|nr:hypothetical protein AX16_008362 [Volvariella volvacea WC 439]